MDILGAVASVLGILTFFGIAVNGQQIVRRIKARLDVRRKRLEEQQQRQLARLAATLIASQKAELDSKFEAWKSLLETALKGQQDSFEHRISQLGMEENTDYHALADRIQALEDRMPQADAGRLNALQRRLADLEVSESKWLRGTFDRSPEAQRIQQSAKEHAQDRQPAFPLGDPRNAGR